MWLKEIWRYPVESMAGESLRLARLRAGRIEGDPVVLAERDGRTLTARRYPGLLAHRAALGPDGEPLVDGRPWSSPEVTADVERAAGPGARLVRYDGPERFDVLPLLVATDGAVEAFGHDGRRLRPNLLIGGVEGLTEREWEGRRLRVGSCVVQIQDLRGRCVMTTYDPDTREQDVEVLKQIQARFDRTLALNAFATEEGTVQVGDAVELMD